MSIQYSAIEPVIKIKRPKNRSCSISFKESGWFKKQTFTSNVFPNEVPFEFIGIVKTSDGIIRPKYKSKIVTSKNLYLTGKSGIRNGVSIMNRICYELFSLNGILDARSINRSDLRDMGDEKLSYWLASPVSDAVLSVVDFGEDIVVYGSSPCSTSSMIFSYDLSKDVGFPIRPVIILNTEVVIRKSQRVIWTNL